MATRTYVVFYGPPEANTMAEVKTSGAWAAANRVARLKALKDGTKMRVSAWNPDRGGGKVTEFQACAGGAVRAKAGAK